MSRCRVHGRHRMRLRRELMHFVILEELTPLAKRITPLLADTSQLFDGALRRGERVLLQCRFAASWGHLTAFFAGSWGHPKRRRMGPPARGRDPVFCRVMGPASEVFCSLMGPARDAAVGI
ncbi:uncharacterized protein SOCE26_024400 [Sorangium cellulosum]|uniref:Uncharacterized protein n=1 Tax=Sorangium cellulosum TaxID=56 RepID=A0A2L0EP31_SORCE|nr:uncharacterized protein SOCE26_024400 [Sorangium cellulosum]